ncbi:threonine synthase [Paenibacillus pini JCM 16418]|uniref:Threonine synthase n=1 Tax=Paenibacillus pini JCM 16418 TaxID=1236976 RepID=W7Z711_9BACL|nr:threonine synthase [Paenibacillus pini JCM 16418]
MAYEGLIQTYKSYLPVNENTPFLTLKEGNTPLIRAENLSEELGLDLYFKYEGLNPTVHLKTGVWLWL